MKKILLISIIVLIFSSCVKNDYKVRPLLIKIESGKEKVKGIPVLYIVYVSGVSFDLHNSYSKMVVFEEYYSDENGLLNIPVHYVKEGVNKKFDEELIFNNLKLNDSILRTFNTSYDDRIRYAELINTFSMELDTENFTLIDNKYNGSFFHINTYSDDVIANMGVVKENIATAHFIGKSSYDKQQEDIVIHLTKR